MLDVYLELGSKRVFAVAADWPGWARSARDDQSALAMLVEYGPRYRRALNLRAPAFVVPATLADVDVIERLDGNATTDFGAPGAIAAGDERATDDDDLDRLIDLLRRSWKAFADAAEAAEGKELRAAGPRGGGRSVDKMRDHVAEADGGYLNALGGRASGAATWTEIQAAFIEALGARARGELPDVGPRGGRRWPARFAIRRSAWHALDHAWEIEDRVTP